MCMDKYMKQFHNYIVKKLRYQVLLNYKLCVEKLRMWAANLP